MTEELLGDVCPLLHRAATPRDRSARPPLQHPSRCDVPASECDVDHIVPVADGGATTQFNGKIECRPHNRDATKHDHGATPLPARPVTVLDEIRAQLRWRNQHYYPNDGDDPDPADEPAA